MEWADAARRMKVRANAETPADARAARSFGAEGIGLCRTEHMFFDADRIVAVREMILADNEAGRRDGARQAPPHAARRLRRAVRDHARAAGDHPPARPAAARVPAEDARRRSPRSPRRWGSTPEKLRERTHGPARVQPDARPSRLPPRHLLSGDRRDAGARHLRGGDRGRPAQDGERGRAGDHGAAGRGQGRARPGQGADRRGRGGGRRASAASRPRYQRRHHDRAAARGAPRRRDRREPREFFSFGTNDLTQTTFGFRATTRRPSSAPTPSRGILASDPFVTLDREGVGELSPSRPSAAAKTRPDIKLGICGEHGGDPASIAFCEEIGLDYVSCSPFRVPIARLAAAQAALKAKGEGEK